jgi:RHS repeat-associated protein
LHGFYLQEPSNVASVDQSNQQYSIYALTDSSGNVSERYAYTAYGQPTFLNASATVQTSSAASNRYTYTAREWDATLGLHHFRARWMSGLTGRFLTRDPIEYGGFNNIIQRFLEAQDKYLEHKAKDRDFGESFSRRGKATVRDIGLQLSLYGYVGDRVLSFADPTGLDRYWIGGSNPMDHSAICVDEYDAAGNKSGVYCCSIASEAGKNGCGGNGGGILDTCNYCLSALGFSYYSITVTCGSTPSVAGFAMGQSITTYASSQSEDQILLNRLKKENGMTWLFNGAMNNCHEHVGRRCPIGLKKGPSR